MTKNTEEMGSIKKEPTEKDYRDGYNIGHKEGKRVGERSCFKIMEEYKRFYNLKNWLFASRQEVDYLIKASKYMYHSDQYIVIAGKLKECDDLLRKIEMKSRDNEQQYYKLYSENID